MISDNIFVHFLDAELQKLYINSSYNPININRFFKTAMFLAFLLAKEKIIIPISNYFESDIAFNLVNYFQSISEHNCIEFASTAPDLNSLLNKKQVEHRNNFEKKGFHYADFLQSDTEIYLPATLKQRRISSSQYIKEDWLSLIGKDETWRELSRTLPNIKYSDLEYRLESVPVQLGGMAYISDYILPLIESSEKNNLQANNAINVVVTKAYIRSYLKEYDAVCLCDTPFILDIVLPSIPNKKHISYKKYCEALYSARYQDKSAFDYVINCNPE
ncbi:MAG: hypothetical protein LBM93_00710, partial [Oscillospiraceae bacterium]|nr:hypothetical protein [Oscillospiraceae bacterium]